ncbi:hypothetical protein CAEBREN_09858 [Caenorhabditis brenneri]|uniref:Uncharacterized protein n=1 Tax=Caenorhabditis brenneri TaxID=135651 RepID=G0MGY6_CAEBE|nr:hypothetical protein CAEBREN_09858 [Caenorhabditis brenneri]
MKITKSMYIGVQHPTRKDGSLLLLRVHVGNDDEELNLEADHEFLNDSTTTSSVEEKKKFETVKENKNPTALDILLSHLDKSDEEVLNLLPLFKNVKTQTLFSFLATIIRNKRYGLIDEVLEIIYTNPKNFPEIKREYHTEFTENGMFIYDYPLPMETALECSDYDLIETISMYYSRTDLFTSRSKNEDICRCLSFVKDQLGVVTDKYRLTIWLMLLKHVDFNSLRFKELADPYSAKNAEDVVPFLLRQLIKKLMDSGNTSVKIAALPMFWPVAFRKAGKLMSRLPITI